MSDPSEVGRKWMSPQGERAVVDQGMRGSVEYVAITTADSTMAALLPLKELEGEIRRDESNVAFRAVTAKRKQEEVEQLADLESLDGFEETLTPAARARAVKALTHKAIQHSGVFYKSSRDLIRALVAAGYEVAGKGSDRRLVSPDGSFFIQKDITKFGMDYAEFLTTRAQRNPDDPDEDVDTNWTKIALVALGGIALWFLVRRR